MKLILFTNEDITCTLDMFSTSHCLWTVTIVHLDVTSCDLGTLNTFKLGTTARSFQR